MLTEESLINTIKFDIEIVSLGNYCITSSILKLNQLKFHKNYQLFFYIHFCYIV